MLTLTTKFLLSKNTTVSWRPIYKKNQVLTSFLLVANDKFMSLYTLVSITQSKTPYNSKCSYTKHLLKMIRVIYM